MISQQWRCGLPGLALIVYNILNTKSVYDWTIGTTWRAYGHIAAKGLTVIISLDPEPLIVDVATPRREIAEFLGRLLGGWQ